MCLDVFSYLLGKKSSGGGSVSGLEYEEGTITLNEDKPSIDITFKKQHTDSPIITAMIDVTNEPQMEKAMEQFMFLDVEKLFGATTPQSSYTNGYAMIAKGYRASETNTLFNAKIAYVLHSRDETPPSNGQAEYYYQYWVTNEMFKAGYPSTSYPWKSGRTFKWIAIWK